MRALAVLLLMVVSAAPAWSQTARRYSGRVEEVDLAEGLVVVDELGRKGLPERHRIRLGPDTPIVSAGRLRAYAMRGPNAYGEVLVSGADLLVGDYVVVESVDGEDGAVALRITIVEVPTPPGRRR